MASSDTRSEVIREKKTRSSEGSQKPHKEKKKKRLDCKKKV